MTKTCKSCNWWDDTVRVLDEESNCRCPKLRYVDYPDSPTEDKDKLVVSDSERYHAYILTGPDFGCIHYKEKN